MMAVVSVQTRRRAAAGVSPRRTGAFIWLISVVAVAGAWPAISAAQTVSIDLMGGTAYNVPTPLTVRQDGFPDLHVTAHYQTKPFGPFAPYYSWRVGVWKGDAGWELQQVHHRLFLSNTTAEIQAFAVHYGYNFFLVGRAWKRRGFVWHASGGVLITNPASTIRGQSLNTPDQGALDVGYHVSGVGAGAALSRAVPLSRHVYVLGEGAVLAGSASVPVASGSARVPTLGFHAHLGLGLQFWRGTEFASRKPLRLGNRVS
jgi:hypothetical protein